MAKSRTAMLAEMLRFAVVGCSNTLIDVGLFTALIMLGLNAVFSNCVSYSAGIISSFLLNRSWTFRSRDPVSAMLFARFLLINLGGLVLSSLLIGVFTRIWSPLPAKLCTLPFTFIWGYGLSKMYVFGDKRKLTTSPGTADTSRVI
jgi:putative flippase GtrA